MVRGTIDWIVGRFRALIERIARPIMERLTRELLKYIAPYIKDALRQARLQDPRGQPIPPSASASIAQQAGQVVQAEAHDIVQGLLKPDGDHFGFQISGTLAAEAFAGVGITGAIAFDVVVDYVHHQFGFFISPAVQGQSYLGAEVKAGGGGAIGFNYATVMSMGSNRGPTKSVEDAFGGPFVNELVGVGGAYGVTASKGHNFYMGARSAFYPQVQGPPTTTRGVDTPDTTTPGTPERREGVDTEEGLFATGSNALTPAGRRQVGQAAAAARTRHAQNPSSRIQIVVTGEASRRWKHPGRQTPDELNDALARDRERTVEAELRSILGQDAAAVEIVPDPEGSSRARRDRVATDDDSQQYRDVTINVIEIIPATADTVTPGTHTPGTTTPGEFGDDPRMSWRKYTPPYLPDVAHGNRPTIGWDSTLSAGLGAEVGVTSMPGSGCRAIPLPHVNFPAQAELPLRIAFGVIKMGVDFVSVDGAGMFRDALGTFTPIAEAILDEQIAEPAANMVIPRPRRTDPSRLATSTTPAYASHRMSSGLYVATSSAVPRSAHSSRSSSSCSATTSPASWRLPQAATSASPRAPSSSRRRRDRSSAPAPR